MEKESEDFYNEFMKGMGQKEMGTIYKVHPNFDKYPKYMQDAIVVNERLQGRMPKTQ